MPDSVSHRGMTSLAEQRRAATEQPAPPRAAAPVAAAEEEQLEHTRNYTAARGTRGVQSVEFELLAGKGPWPSLEYAFLKETWWTPGDRQQVIELAFTTGVKVTVAGWGLRRMYELLRQHRISAVREDGKDPVKEKAAGLEPEPSWIHSIEVEKPEEEGEDA